MCGSLATAGRVWAERVYVYTKKIMILFLEIRHWLLELQDNCLTLIQLLCKKAEKGMVGAFFLAEVYMM